MFGKTLRASFRQLGMMTAVAPHCFAFAFLVHFQVVITGIIFFSTLIYYLEKDEIGTSFTSIPSACWFSIATM